VTSVTLVRQIKARPSIVYEAFTRPENIIQWWGPDAGPVLIAETDVRIGGAYRVRFRMLDGAEHESVGRYLDVIPDRRLVFSWCWLGEGEPAEESRVTVDLRATKDGTELTFTHERLADEASADRHREGWSGALDKLARRLEAAGGNQR
jgi:uncharacterized protein YndB with AHSA1/START domain